MFRLFYKHVYDLYRQHPAFQAEYEDSSSPRRPDITFVAVDRRCGRAKMREITVTSAHNSLDLSGGGTR